MNKKKLPNMNKLKKFSAYAITFLVLAIGLTSLISFFSFHESSPNSPFAFISIIGSMIVFFPAFDYWLEVAKKLLKIRD
jgi:hypothetical protein